MPEIIECKEFEELSIRVSAILKDGELNLDERITSKGYLTASMKGGQITLRAARFVGTIPLTPYLSLRVIPRATISNLSYMLVRSGVIPSAISGFSRGYLPRFETMGDAEKIYARSLVEGIRLIARRGFMKEYLRPEKPAPWRGRLLTSETVRKHAAKGVRFRHEFEQNVLTSSTIENIALKLALKQVLNWLDVNDKRSKLIPEARELFRSLQHISDWSGSKYDLLRLIGLRINALSPRLPHYRDPLWSAYLILQSVLPDISREGFVRLDSLIIDVSEVFEAFLRRELAARLNSHGFKVKDGNKAPYPFFVNTSCYTVHPDIIIFYGNKIVAVLDAKYKLDPKETDRYEVLSFMDAMGVNIGGFVCPANGIDASRFLGSTLSGKQFVLLRYDLAATDLDAEADRFALNVLQMINMNHNFI